MLLSTAPNLLILFYNHSQIYVAESHKYLDAIINLWLNLELQFNKAYKKMSTKWKLLRKSKYYLNDITKKNKPSYHICNQLSSITV